MIDNIKLIIFNGIIAIQSIFVNEIYLSSLLNGLTIDNATGVMTLIIKIVKEIEISVK